MKQKKNKQENQNSSYLHGLNDNGGADENREEPFESLQEQSSAKQSDKDQMLLHYEQNHPLDSERSAGTRDDQQESVDLVYVGKPKKAKKAKGLDLLKAKTKGIIQAKRFASNDYVYSSGESPTYETAHFHIPYGRLASADQRLRITWLWHTAYRKAFGASLILRKVESQNKRVYIDGFNRPANLRSAIQPSASDGFTAEVTNEEKATKAKCIILPGNRIKTAWDFVIVLLLIYTAFFVPFRVCFEDESSESQFIFDCFMDLCFFIDIILTFFTATQENSGSPIIVDKG